MTDVARTLEVAADDVAVVRAESAVRPSVAVVLGSGLSAAVEGMEDAFVVPYSSIPGFPRVEHVAGHAGELMLGRLAGVGCAVFSGRAHIYQGVSALDAAYPVRLAAGLGAGTVLLTNASGSLDHSLSPGSLAVIRDHVNLMGASPLTGWPGPPGGTPFVAMGEAYDPALRELALTASAETGVGLREAVYAGVPGPSYETPAECEALRRIGADIVGMSTVPEVIAARALGVRVLALSVVANYAGGAALDHAEVMEAGRRALGDLTTLLAAILRAVTSD